MSDSDKKDEPKKDGPVDDELSNLLESALEDFNKPVEDKATEEKKSADSNASELSEDFIQQALTQFESDFANFLSSGNSEAQISPEFVQQKLQQMAEAANQVVSNPSAAVSNNSSDIASSISQAVQGLAEGAEGLQNPFSEEDLMKMFGQGGQGGPNEFVPFMQGMMQGLLSKEVLGPSLQDFVDRFPAYLDENKDKISAEDKERYTKQRDLMVEVLEELNKEKDTDTTQEKSDRFTKVLGLMQKLQDYGQPPAQLVGDFETPFKFDVQGNPADNPECSIM